MTKLQFQDAINAAGYHCLGPDDRGQFFISNNLEGFGTGGITFGANLVHDQWEIYLFAPRSYACGPDTDVLSVCLDLLSGRFVPKDRPPYVMPVELIEKHHLHEIPVE